MQALKLSELMGALSHALDITEGQSEGHCVRCCWIGMHIGQTLALSTQQLWELYYTLLLKDLGYDVGKLGVSNAILDKPGKLDEAEWAAVRRHAVYTGSILGRIRNFDELSRVSAAHHERLDGGGYPWGLKTADITLETRIITTADIFDAITVERPYRGAVPVEKTLAIMKESLGTAIDANCFAHLQKIIRTSPEFFPK